MTTHTTPPTIHSAALPDTIRAFLAAHTAREADAAVRTFTRDAVVVDDGEIFHGTEQVLAFLRNAGSQYTYTTEFISARREDDAHWEVVNRIEGDFPGNVADLTYRFTLTDGLISELTIG
ncbi:nuclear transport factor 2 family protein [Brachybacterium sp. GCM10030267]|uniref:nuclear transport factor 2 family protein n=1 Tax=Brachybacterium sp. GCM10030267 TaxID=3273381 RepID=UPI003614271F